jgi:uncharacterized protein
MKFDLHSLQGATKDFAVTLPSEDVALGAEEGRLTAPVEVSGSVTETSGRFRVKGLITGRLESACTRCLESADRDIRIDFTVDFVSPEHFSSAAEHEVAGDDLDLDVLESDSIDITELVREQIVLNIPAQVLCREDCKGICPKCGGDRNLIDCKCEESEIDPRWAALKGLK